MLAGNTRAAKIYDRAMNCIPVSGYARQPASCLLFYLPGVRIPSRRKWVLAPAFGPAPAKMGPGSRFSAWLKWASSNRDYVTGWGTWRREFSLTPQRAAAPINPRSPYQLETRS